jgi:integrase/recombinase XerD
MVGTDWITGFDRLLAHTGLAVGTRAVYCSAVRRWLDFGGHAGHVDRDLLLRYLGERRRARSQASVNSDLKALRRFYAFQVMCGHCAPGSELKVPSGRATPPRLVRTLSVAQLALVLTAPDPNTWIGYRDTVLLRLLADTGLRPRQAHGLTVAHVLDDNTLYIAHSQRRDARYATISTELRAMLHRYIERRQEVRPRKRVALWLTTRGKALEARTITVIVSRHCQRVLGRELAHCAFASTGRPWHGYYPHLLRATLTQAYIERGLPLTQVAQLLGYADVGSVMRYQAIDVESLRAATAKHPRIPLPARDAVPAPERPAAAGTDTRSRRKPAKKSSS